MSDEVVEAVVCAATDLSDGQMKEVELGGTKILLIKEKGKYSAIGAKCSHYGASLINGVLCNGHVRCPWHGACFNTKTGDIEDYPGVDSIPAFEVSEKNGKISVKAKKSVLEKTKRTRNMAAPGSDKTTVLIIGGGPAAATCAETLRQEGFNGKIIVTSKEKNLPYDRPKLSKAPSVTADQISLRNQNFYNEHHIDFKLSKEAAKVDVQSKKVSFKDGEELSYDKLVLATGTYARVLSMVPGYDLKNVVTLRTLEDANFIAHESAGKDVVIVGTSFIGIEVAAALTGKVKSVTVVDMVEAPFQLALGKEVGNAVKKLLDEKGVKFHFQTTTKEIVGESGKVKEVILKDGTKLPADLLIMGVGVAPTTEFLKDSGLEITDRGFVKVDKHMLTNKPDVYAIGDITQFPLFIAKDEHVNIQHYQMAQQQGRIAALNIAGKKTEIRSVPFFWTMLCGKSIRYTGYGFGYDDIVVHGSMDDLKFVTFYTKGDAVVAAAALNFDPVAGQVAEMFLTGETLTKTEIKKDPLGWTNRLQSHQTKF